MNWNYVTLKKTYKKYNISSYQYDKFNTGCL